MPDATRFALSVSRATKRARRAPRLQVERVDARPGHFGPVPFRLFGRLGEQRVELTRFGGRVEVYTVDDDGLASFVAYAGPVLRTQVRAVLA